jgi:hypothetical protein
MSKEEVRREAARVGNSTYGRYLLSVIEE